MRLITRKIYRAFPELDQFDDETCSRYIRRMWSQQEIWMIAPIIIALVPITWIAWFVIMIAVSIVFDLPVYPELSDCLILMQSGFGWMPVVTGLLARDFWLRKQIRNHMNGATCKSCGYSLIGLKINPVDHVESVLCPECGTDHDLDEDVLAKEDIEIAVTSS